MKITNNSAKYYVGLVMGIMLIPCLATTSLSADDPGLQYSGRIDFSIAGTAIMSWPGSSVAGNFEGTYLAVRMNDQLGANFYNVFIDGALDRPMVIHAVRGEGNYVLAANLAPGAHSFLITKRTEGEDGSTAIKSFELQEGARLLPPPARLQRRIEFFGDSITSGLGNESADDGPDNLPKDKNNFLAYDAIAARNLGAELHVTSQSGIGVMVSWFPFIMPQFYKQLSAVGLNDSRWDFAKWIPQVVVINLFQNDRWLIEREHRLDPEPTDQQRIDAYVAFVRTIRGIYPDAYIVCALGDMDATEKGSKWPGYVTSAVEQLKLKQGDKMIDTFFFEFSGFGAHPRLRHHREMAAKLTEFIRAKMQW